jgi:hypothetical protein
MVSRAATLSLGGVKSGEKSKGGERGGFVNGGSRWEQLRAGTGGMMPASDSSRRRGMCGGKGGDVHMSCPATRELAYTSGLAWPRSGGVGY